MTRLARTTAVTTAALLAFTVTADARVRHHRHKAPAVAIDEAAPPQRQAPQRRGVAGYFGPGAYGPFGYGPLGLFSPGYGYGGWYGYPRGDLGFRGFVECGNYYARYPGACGF